MAKFYRFAIKTAYKRSDFGPLLAPAPRWGGSYSRYFAIFDDETDPWSARFGERFFLLLRSKKTRFGEKILDFGSRHLRRRASVPPPPYFFKELQFSRSVAAGPVTHMACGGGEIASRLPRLERAAGSAVGQTES